MDNYGDFFRLIRFSFISDFNNERKKKKIEFIILKLFLTHSKLNIHCIY